MPEVVTEVAFCTSCGELLGQVPPHVTDPDFDVEEFVKARFGLPD